jgi:hypothetical protein
MRRKERGAGKGRRWRAMSRQDRAVESNDQYRTDKLGIER